MNVALHSSKFSVEFSKSPRGRTENLRIRQFLLNRIFRYYKLPEDTSPFPEDLYNELSAISQIPVKEVKAILFTFLKEMEFTSKFLKSCDLLSSADPSKSRIYLHKCYRIAPIFDYKRARENLYQLQEFFKLEGYWQKITSQITFAIYITDKKNPLAHRKIKQNNLQRFTSCSAYAFHRLINRLKSRGIQV